MSERRVVITGIGMLSSVGHGRAAVWDALIAGQCGIAPLTLFDGTGYRSRMVAEIRDLPGAGCFSAWERRRYSRGDQVAVLATAEAVEDSGLLDSGLARDRIGVFLGVGTNDLLRNEEYCAEVLARGFARARPSRIFSFFNDTPVDVVAARFGLDGARACSVSACSSSAVAIGYAGDAIRAGQLDAAVSGGSDVLSRLTLSGFNALRLVDLNPCRPFDAGRAGMNIGEAGAVLLLEEADHARRRGAHVYAELAGYGATCEAFHATSPEPQGVAVASLLRTTLAGCGVDVSEVDHINAHGTGTVQNDRAEARGINLVFGERTGSIPVTSVKSMVGHCLAAAGAIEAATLALTIERGVIPPTIHHSTTDPECAVQVVANEARETAVRCGLSISLAFGGNDAALVLRRYE